MDINEELKFLRKFKKKIGGGGGSGRVGGGGQGGCERRIEVFAKIPKKKNGGGVGLGGSGGGVGLGGGFRVDVIEELKFLGKFTKKMWGSGGGGGWVGVEGLVGRVQGGCERRI